MAISSDFSESAASSSSSSVNPFSVHRTANCGRPSQKDESRLAWSSEQVACCWAAFFLPRCLQLRQLPFQAICLHRLRKSRTWLSLHLVHGLQIFTSQLPSHLPLLLQPLYQILNQLLCLHCGLHRLVCLEFVLWFHVCMFDCGLFVILLAAWADDKLAVYHSVRCQGGVKTCCECYHAYDTIRHRSTKPPLHPDSEAVQRVASQGERNAAINKLQDEVSSLRQKLEE